MPGGRATSAENLVGALNPQQKRAPDSNVGGYIFVVLVAS